MLKSVTTFFLYFMQFKFNRVKRMSTIYWCIGIFKYMLRKCPVAEFSVPICSSTKFICSSHYGVPRLLNRKYASYKSKIYKNRMM